MEDNHFQSAAYQSSVKRSRFWTFFFKYFQRAIGMFLLFLALLSLTMNLICIVLGYTPTNKYVQFLIWIERSNMNAIISEDKKLSLNQIDFTTEEVRFNMLLSFFINFFILLISLLMIHSSMVKVELIEVGRLSIHSNVEPSLFSSWPS